MRQIAYSKIYHLSFEDHYIVFFTKPAKIQRSYSYHNILSPVHCKFLIMISPQILTSSGGTTSLLKSSTIFLAKTLMVGLTSPAFG
jgi:hypothetical protein